MGLTLGLLRIWRISLFVGRAKRVALRSSRAFRLRDSKDESTRVAANVHVIFRCWYPILHLPS